jgi:hypothetical protein
MGTCRICQQECSEDQQFCKNCGYPLTTFPPTLGEIPQAFQEILSQRERWEQNIWQKYEQLQRQFQQLQQEASNNQQQQQQIDQLKQENARLGGQVESYSQFQQSQQQLIEQLREVLQESQRRQSPENSQSNQQLQQQVGQLQQEIANLRQENARLGQKLESQSSSQQQEEVPLKSAVGYNYTKLRDLLANQKWKEADKETAKAMLTVAGRDEFLREEDIDNFPCEDLRTIDRLWVKFSNGKFGFSVQKEIYQQLGGTTRKFDLDIWIKFGDTVGWRDDGRWKNYRELNWRRPLRDNTPEGHLPIPWVFGFFDKLVWFGFLGVSSLAQRLVNCNI